MYLWCLASNNMDLANRLYDNFKVTPTLYCSVKTVQNVNVTLLNQIITFQVCVGDLVCLQ